MGSSQSHGHPLRHTGQEAPFPAEGKEKAKKYFRKGNEKFSSNDFNGAKLQYRKALDALKSADHDAGQSNRATALSNIACIEFAEGRFQEAQSLFDEAMQILKSVGSSEKKQEKDEEEKDGSGAEEVATRAEDGDNSAESMKSLRLIIKRNHKAHDKQDECNKMATILQDHEQVDSICADACNNMAACLETQGYFEEAKRFYDEALKLRKLIYGPRCEKVAECLQNIGTVNDKLGYLVEAETLYKEALSIFKDINGEKSRDVSMVLNNLGLLYNAMGKMDDAEQCLSTSLAILEGYPLYGEASDIAATKGNLQYVSNKRKSLAACGKPSAALSAFGCPI